MKRFLKQPGGADHYRNVRIAWERHHEPEMVVSDSEGQSVTYDLSRYSHVELHKLMRRLGFELKQGAATAPEAAAIQPVTAGAAAGAARARPAAATAGAAARAEPALDEAPSATAAPLPPRDVDAHVLAGGGGAPRAAGGLGLRDSVMAAIKAGDEILAQGLVRDGISGRASLLKVAGGAVCVAALFALLLCCRADLDAAGGVPHAHDASMQPHRLRGLHAAYYAPLSPVPEMLSPARTTAAEKNV